MTMILALHGALLQNVASLYIWVDCYGGPKPRGHVLTCAFRSNPITFVTATALQAIVTGRHTKCMRCYREVRQGIGLPTPKSRNQTAGEDYFEDSCQPCQAVSAVARQGFVTSQQQ